MTQTDDWEAAQIAASLTTYIAGIEDTLKQPMMQSVAYLITQIAAIYETLDPIVGAAFEHANVNLPWESSDD